MGIIKKIIIVALGVIMINSLQSCGVIYGCYDAGYGYGGYDYGYGYGLPSAYPLNRTSELGTMKIGNNTWSWANMTLVKRGLVVYVESNGSVLRRYDLRVRGADYEESFAVEGWTGKALSVNISITGGYDAFFTVSDGNRKEHYSL